AASGEQSHPVIGLWRVALRDELRHALVVEDIRKIDRWTARYPLATVTWPVQPLDPFFNANTVEDIAEAERLARLAERPAQYSWRGRRPASSWRPNARDSARTGTGNIKLVEVPPDPKPDPEAA